VSLGCDALATFLVAIALGGVVGWSGDAAWASVIHVGAAALALGAALVVVAGALRGEAAPLASARDYLTLTKPRIMTLLLLTGGAGMFVGAQGVPPPGLFAGMSPAISPECAAWPSSNLMGSIRRLK
jgi:hypothetical protein